MFRRKHGGKTKNKYHLKLDVLVNKNKQIFIKQTQTIKKVIKMSILQISGIEMITSKKKSPTHTHTYIHTTFITDAKKRLTTYPLQI